ncbi:ABC transporter permease [Rubripirellula reticaptiva]|uniref:Ribose transport system permease protein RbsC n=1 Tax=Rubripirellula reticaptiva TaxID=2528013 RepID=A0A5C6F5A7_9BACT|nr:ABC transporter permease [Rubripirellula reticaptiva]TWU55704.1 Ribose transport system permease protein RbsC [Rubripirellula reticaptiva]
MKKILGILGLLVFICVMTALMSDRFLTQYNIENLLRRSALFGILSIGAAFVIITGGIDLSIGSVVCLVGCLLPWMMVDQGLSVPAALAIVAAMSLGIGVTHGLLITKMRLQPFVVTLCGLLFYRGLTRGIVQDQTQGFQGEFKTLRAVSQGQISLPGTDFGLPMPCLILFVVAVAAIVFLNLTVYGRYMLALGRNETATRLSGVNTDRMIILAYVICGCLSGLGGMLFVLDVGSALPVDFGNFYELYAIAGAVLGGCSLRGGQGTIIGVVIGSAVMQVLKNTITLVDWIPTNIEFAVIGAVILGGVIADEGVKRYAARRRSAK